MSLLAGILPVSLASYEETIAAEEVFSADGIVEWSSGAAIAPIQGAVTSDSATKMFNIAREMRRMPAIVQERDSTVK